MPKKPLLEFTDRGIYCDKGKFYIDPWKPVDDAVITHAHADHAYFGHKHYLAHHLSKQILLYRLGEINLQTVEYGEKLMKNGVEISLFPAGHVIGSAQIRIEYQGEVWVVSGDYKMEADATCEAFEPLDCNTFITESTFGLPIYRWQPQDAIFSEINNWWQGNAVDGRASVLFCYAFGKAQRIQGGIDNTNGPMICHGATEAVNGIYRQSGIALAI